MLNVRAEANKSLCLDCHLEEDSTVHKIFFCPTFEGDARQDLIQSMNTEYTSDYKLRVLFTTNTNLRRSFRHQVKYICLTSDNDDEYAQKSLIT